MLHCAHVCVCLCLRTSVCVPVGLCVPCFWRQNLSLAWSSFTKLDWLAKESRLPPLQTGITPVFHHAWHFLCVFWDQAQMITLVWQSFYSAVSSPQPQAICFFSIIRFQVLNRFLKIKDTCSQLKDGKEKAWKVSILTSITLSYQYIELHILINKYILFTYLNRIYLLYIFSILKNRASLSTPKALLLFC